MRKLLYLCAITIAFITNAYAEDFNIGILKELYERSGYKFKESDAPHQYFVSDNGIAHLSILAKNHEMVNEISLSIGSGQPKDVIRDNAENIYVPLVADTHGVKMWINNCIYRQNIDEYIEVDDYEFICEIYDGNLHFRANKF